MADRPILFSAPMVRALLAGRKTQTRRVLKPQPQGHVWKYGWSRDDGATWSADGEVASGRIPIWAGDRLWVRERIAYRHDVPEDKARDQRWYKPVYEADGVPSGFGISDLNPAMFMPRWASRLTLTVTDVKIERLQDISEADAKAEGIQDGGCRKCGESSHPEPCGCVYPEPDFADSYFALWNEINGKDAALLNPWVAAYTFRVEHGNIDAIGRAAA